MSKIVAMGRGTKKCMRLIACTVCILWHVAVQGQAVPPPTVYSVRFEAQHGEAFSVFIDGELQNRLPQSRVLVGQMTNQTHEVVVVLKRPAEKCAVLHLKPAERDVVVNVNYDQRLEQLYLFTPTYNRVELEPRSEVEVVDPSLRRTALPERKMRAASDSTPASQEVDNESMEMMLRRLKSQSFESDRLSLAKVLVAATPLTCAQIASLAATLDYSNSRVEFLKHAYAYCLDTENYYTTTDVLTFTADKKKVLDYIATQR